MSQSDSSESDEADLGNDGSNVYQVFTIKVEYYRSFEYSVKWRDPMKPKSKSKRPKTTKSQNDSCGGDSIQHRVRGKRQQKGPKKASPANTKVEVDKLCTSDIIDFIDRSHEDKPEEWDASVEVTDEQCWGNLPNTADEGVDHLDDDTSSVKSGPSFPEELSAKKTQTLCPACHKLYQKAKRMKAPLKDKLLDTNPKSLSCDQWILLKPWSSRAMPDRRGSLSQLIHKVRMVKDGRNKNNLLRKVCSRPHLFLLRNLHYGIRKPLKREKRKNKRNKRKRAREDSQSPRVAKQQRLLNHHHRPISNDFSHDNSIQPVRNGLTHNGPDPMSTHCSSTSSLEGGEDSDLTLGLCPESVTSEADSLKACPNQSVSKRAGGFKELLAQLRCNSSMIIRECVAEVIPK